MSGSLPPPPPVRCRKKASRAAAQTPNARPGGPLPPLWSVLLTLVIVFAVAGCWIAGDSSPWAEAISQP